jgi:hypothetical protein
VKTVRAAAVRSPDADMRPRREREGCARMAGEGENWEGEVKGAQQRCDTLLRRHGREGGRSSGGAPWRRGVGRGVGASAVWPTAARRGARRRHACGRHVIGGKTGEVGDCQVGPRHSNGRWDLNSKKKKSNLI